MKVFTIADIEIDLHWSFTLLFFIVILYLTLFDQKNFFSSITIFVFLFLSVFFHELSHSMVAQNKGIKVKKIILLPIGGVSLSEGLIEKPKDEFLIAIAGPLFNFLIVFAILLLVSVIPLPFPYHLMNQLTDPYVLEQALMSYPLFSLLWLNLILGVFNLFVPALPMDGGRVLRALLSFPLGNLQATRIAATISKMLAVFLFVLGFLLGNIILALIAVFVFIGSQQETGLAVIKAELKKLNIYDVINFRPIIISNENTLKDAFNLMQLYKKEALLIPQKQGYAIITLSTLSSIPKSEWNTEIKKFAVQVPSINLKEKTDKIIELMLLKGFSLLPITKDNTLIGVIEREALEKAIEFQKVKEANP